MRGRIQISSYLTKRVGYVKFLHSSQSISLLILIFAQMGSEVEHSSSPILGDISLLEKSLQQQSCWWVNDFLGLSFPVLLFSSLTAARCFCRVSWFPLLHASLQGIPEWVYCLFGNKSKNVEIQTPFQLCSLPSECLCTFMLHLQSSVSPGSRSVSRDANVMLLVLLMGSSCQLWACNEDSLSSLSGKHMDQWGHDQSMYLRPRIMMRALNDTPSKLCSSTAHCSEMGLGGKNQAPQTLSVTEMCYLLTFSVISLKFAKYLPISCNITMMRIKV